MHSIHVTTQALVQQKAMEDNSAESIISAESTCSANCPLVGACGDELILCQALHCPLHLYRRLRLLAAIAAPFAPATLCWRCVYNITYRRVPVRVNLSVRRVAAHLVAAAVTATDIGRILTGGCVAVSGRGAARHFGAVGRAIVQRLQVAAVDFRARRSRLLARSTRRSGMLALWSGSQRCPA